MSSNLVKKLLQGWISRTPEEDSSTEFFGAADDPSHPRLLRHALEQLIFTRIFTLTAFLTMIMVSLVTAPNGVVHIREICWSIAVVFAVSIGNLIWLRKTSDSSLRVFATVQFAVDVILATGAIGVTNTAVAMFLYLFLIVAAALVLGRKASVVLAAESALAYSLLNALLYSAGTHATFVDILSVYLSLVSVAVLASYLARRFEVVGELAREQAKHLVQLRDERAGIIEDLSEGVIVIDNSGKILDFNPAVLAMFGWTKEHADNSRGRPFRQVLESLVLDDDRPKLPGNFANDSQCEFRLSSADPTQVRHCTLSSRPLPGVGTQEPRGAVVVLTDRSHQRTIEERLRLHEKMTELLAEQSSSRTGAQSPYYAEMAGESAVMRKVFELVERVAGSSASVLIQGESGTGKELIARAIHNRGPRSEHPFVAINCGALPENLIESELFGHKKGAFTGATHDSQGLFRQAQGGTLFLDEIGELPLHLQTKLLRVLQEKTVRAVGDTRDYPVDVRVLAATNRDLRSEVNSARFREDLFYRLNVVNISVPPLRERKEDVPLLVRHSLERLCQGRAFPQLSPEALQLLMLYPFPGNIRELENIMERALVLGGGAILPEHLPDEVRRKSSTNGQPAETQFITLPIDLESELETLERAYLLRALSESRGVKKQAAEMLGLNFRSFRYRLKKYSLASSNGDEDSEEEQSLDPS